MRRQRFVIFPFCLHFLDSMSLQRLLPTFTTLILTLRLEHLVGHVITYWFASCLVLQHLVNHVEASRGEELKVCCQHWASTGFVCV